MVGVMNSALETKDEIERKFLILNFNWNMIPSGLSPIEIVQYYLLTSPGSKHERRVRKTWQDEKLKYDYTEKYPTDDPRRREEPKRALTVSEFIELLSERDPICSPIRKSRWLIPHGSHILELDRYRDVPDLYTVEIESDHVDFQVEAPAGWQWLEVTDDPEYKNRRISELILKKQAHHLSPHHK